MRDGSSAHTAGRRTGTRVTCHLKRLYTDSKDVAGIHVSRALPWELSPQLGNTREAQSHLTFGSSHRAQLDHAIRTT